MRSIGLAGELTKEKASLLRLDLYRLPISRKAIPWIIWGVAGVFYFFEIILRMLPGTMSAEYVKLFNINDTQFGMFTAFYYFSYTTMQIPAGLIVDRFSIRKTLFFACLACVSGFLLIHSTRQLHIAELGRFIVGFGSAFAYVSSLKVASIWLPPNRFGLASCIIDSLGMIGAMFAEIVIVRMDINYGYSSSIHFLLITGIIVAALIFLILQDSPASESRHGKPKKEINIHDKSDVIEKVIRISKNPQIWIIGAIGCLFYLPSSVLGDVYGIPYLKSVYHLTRRDASLLMTTFFAGWVLVGPLLGALSDKFNRRCLPIVITLIVDTILFSLLIFTPMFTSIRFSMTTLLLMFFFIGVATGSHPLVFALAKENYSNRIAGTVVALTNTLIMLGGLLFQPIVGFLLDLNHGSVGALGVQHYTAHNYLVALSIIPVSLMICIVLMFFVKETGHRLHHGLIK